MLVDTSVRPGEREEFHGRPRKLDGDLKPTVDHPTSDLVRASWPVMKPPTSAEEGQKKCVGLLASGRLVVAVLCAQQKVCHYTTGLTVRDVSGIRLVVTDL